MSYILDALNRSEQERNGHATGQEFTEEMLPAVSHNRPRGKGWGIVAAVTLVLLASFAAYHFGILGGGGVVIPGQSQPEDKVLAPVVPATMVKEGVDNELAKQSVTAEVLTKSRVAEKEGAKSVVLADRAETDRSETAAVEPAKPMPKPKPKPKLKGPASEVAALYRAGSLNSERTLVKTDDVANAENSEISELYRQHELAPDDVYSDADAYSDDYVGTDVDSSADEDKNIDERLGLPTIDQLSWQQQEAIPDMEYSAHIFSSRADKSFVIINGAKRYSGDNLAAGVDLLGILPQSILLSYRGTEFLLPAMQNWRR